MVISIYIKEKERLITLNYSLRAKTRMVPWVSGIQDGPPMVNLTISMLTRIFQAMVDWHSSTMGSLKIMLR